jgi:hypothetical protein
MKGVKNGIYNTKQAARLLKQIKPERKESIERILNTEVDTPQTVQQKSKVIRKYKQQSLQEKRSMIAQHQELRQETLKELEQTRKEAYQQPLADTISKIRSKEKHRNSWRKIKSTFNPIQKAQFNTLDVPDQDEEGMPTNDPERAISWKTLTDPESIENQSVSEKYTTFWTSERFTVYGKSIPIGIWIHGDYRGSSEITSWRLQHWDTIRINRGSNSLTKQIK